MGKLSDFDERHYLGQSEGLLERAKQHFAGHALLDYIWFGASERLNPGAAFDEAYYLANNPDVAKAAKAAEFVCGYHHYLKNGLAEGRRGVPPQSFCVIDAGLLSGSDASVVADLASRLQRVRPAWRLMIIAGFQCPRGTALHPWVEWVESSSVEEGQLKSLAAEIGASYLICLAAPTLDPMGHAAVVALGDPTAMDGVAWGVADAVLAPDYDAVDPVAVADRLAVAVETAAQVKARMNRTDRLGDPSTAAIGSGLSIPVAVGDGARVVTVAVDLPQHGSASKELLVVEVAGEQIVLEATRERPAHSVFRIGSAATRISIRPAKSGYRAVGRLRLARVEAAPVDLVSTSVETGAASDGLLEIDLNTDLARVKREFGRFLAKADTVIERRPAIEFGVPSLPTLLPFAIPRCLIVSTFSAEGSWAESETLDVAAWREYLRNRGFLVEFLELPLETASDAGRLLKLNLTDHRFLVLTSPRAAELLDGGLARARHVVRIYRGAVSGGRLVAPLRRSDDLACARLADRVIVAGAGEAAYYRSAGVPAGRIDYAPEFLPAPFRRLSRPYEARPRQAVLYLDSLAVLENRIAEHRFSREAVVRLTERGWRIVICALPRLRNRIEADLDFGSLSPEPTWCDPSVDLPAVLHATRLIIAPRVDPARIGGLISAARIIGIHMLVEGPLRGAEAAHLAAIPASASDLDGLEEAAGDPGSLDMEVVRADAFRSLDRVIGFRDAGWREGRGDRSPDI